MKITLIIVASIIALVIIIKKVKNIILNFQLHKVNTYNKDNLDGYLHTLLNKPISSINIDILTGLIHKYIISDLLFTAHSKYVYKKATQMLEETAFEQAGIIINMKKYLQDNINGHIKSISELRMVTENVLKQGQTEMNNKLKA